MDGLVVHNILLIAFYLLGAGFFGGYIPLFERDKGIKDFKQKHPKLFRFSFYLFLALLLIKSIEFVYSAF